MFVYNANYMIILLELQEIIDSQQQRLLKIKKGMSREQMPASLNTTHALIISGIRQGKRDN